MIEAGEKVCAISLPFEWVDIGCVTDFWQATRLILEGRVKGLAVPGREVRPGVHVGLGVNLPSEGVTINGPVYIGSGTTIERGVRIDGPASIGANCVVHAGAHIHQSILGDYTRVAVNSMLDKRIVFAGKFIEPSGDSIDLHDADLTWLLSDARSPIDDSQHQELRQAMSAAAMAAA